MKKLTVLIILAMLISMVAAAAVHADEAWKAANIDDGSQTTEELYELAKQEGKVVVYSISSRMDKALAAFMEDFPGIEAEVVNMKTDVVKEKVMTEYKSGIKGADLVHVSDLDGMVYNEYVLAGIMYPYYPDDIVAKIDTDT